MELIQQIKALARDIAGDVVGMRRYIHAHPEMSFEEHNTAQYIADALRKLGLEVQEGIAGTGVVALVHGRDAGQKTVALRADIDALPIVEQNDVPYKSTNRGVMHACGHDVHTASLLGTAIILTRLKDHFSGSVKLIFQPGEEKAPGGASLMIREGVLENPKPSSIFGQHVMTQIPAGKVGFREGLYMASADELYLTVRGSGGHAAMPDKNVDPIIIASTILVTLQQIVSRQANPTTPTVLSFGRIVGEGATNVIPDEVKIEGTFRTLDERWRREALEKMKKAAESIAEGLGARCDFNIVHGYPFLHNHEGLTRRARQYAEEYMGAENVVDLDVWMAAEDFSYYSQEMDACFYRLGVRNDEKGIVSGVHTPTFNIDEHALEIGPGLMAWLALRTLEE
jgi:amidohydrolase